MRITIAGLRGWIIGVGLLLLTVLVLFLAYARYKAHRFISDLPKKLGVTIASSSDSYTLSRTGKDGKTAFTLHASKAVQFKDGAGATLHDVVITLYGAQGDRSDRIAGNEFNYDQKLGIISAKGDVQIDLQGASAGSDSGSETPGSAAGAVHVKTSGLVFYQKSQVATTPQYVEFTTPKGAGHSTGATYDVQKGLLVLGSNVELQSSRDGKPIEVHATHAEFLRSSMQAFLLNPVSKYQTDESTSDRATVYFREDGSAEHIDALGHVHLKSDDGQEITAGSARILLDARSQPLRADASGGLNFVSTGDVQQMHGNAVEGTLTFGLDGTLKHGQARNAVSLVDQQRGVSGDPDGSATRELRASQVDIDFMEAPDGHAVADKLLASGGATAVLHTVHSKNAAGNPAAQNTTMKGDQLLAMLENGKAIRSVHGTGHTSVLDISPTGATSLSTGDALQVNFSTATGGGHASLAGKEKTPVKGEIGRAKGTDGVRMDSAQIESVVQEGNVVVVQTPPAKPGGADAPSPTRATAHRIEYTAANQLLQMQGSPRIVSGETDLTADAIDYLRETAVANGTGNVKATYLEAGTGQGKTRHVGGLSAGFGGQGPTHVVAATAMLDQTRGLATFHGDGHSLARLWQGANSVSAPVIELSRNPEALKAYSDTAGAESVSTVITSAAGAGPAIGANGAAAQRQPSVFRVHSRQLLYSDLDKKALFTGAVTAEDANGTVRSDQVEVFMAAGGAPGKMNTAAGAGQGRIDRIQASGHVVLQQTGRHGNGDKLVYTALDGKFVLTGTVAVLPHLYDQAHGTVSGEALIFNSQDDSVSVTGGLSKAVTDTRTAK